MQEKELSLLDVTSLVVKDSFGFVSVWGLLHYRACLGR